MMGLTRRMGAAAAVATLAAGLPLFGTNSANAGMHIRSSGTDIAATRSSGVPSEIHLTSVIRSAASVPAVPCNQADGWYRWWTSNHDGVTVPSSSGNHPDVYACGWFRWRADLNRFQIRGKVWDTDLNDSRAATVVFKPMWQDSDDDGGSVTFNRAGVDYATFGYPDQKQRYGDDGEIVMDARECATNSWGPDCPSGWKHINVP